MTVFSVIIPNHNSGLYLKRAIESVYSQSYQNWEILLVDDCSTDNSISIIKKKYKDQNKIKFIHLEHNFGAWKARNIGIEASSGRYIAFLDSDDIWHPQKLEMQLSFMAKNKYPLTYTNYAKINESGSLIDHIELPNQLSYIKMLKSNFMPCLTVVYDTDYFGKQYMPPLRKRQDYGLWLKLLRKTDHAYGLQKELAYYRVRKNSISRNKISLLKYNWHLFYNIEKLGFWRSSKCLLNNIIYKFIRKN